MIPLSVLLQPPRRQLQLREGDPGGGGGPDPEDDCPAELAATREKLQLAEDFITQLEVAYDTLRDRTLVKLAERDAKVASAMSTLALRESDLTSSQATISARNSDLTTIHASLTSRDMTE